MILKRILCFLFAMLLLNTALQVPAKAAEEPSAVPLFFQTDYPNDRYGSGTVASSGCGITSLAMVASYMTGHTYYPDELADYFGGYGKNNIERLDLRCQCYAGGALYLCGRKAGCRIPV